MQYLVLESRKSSVSCFIKLADVSACVKFCAEAQLMWSFLNTVCSFCFFPLHFLTSVHTASCLVIVLRRVNTIWLIDYAFRLHFESRIWIHNNNNNPWTRRMIKAQNAKFIPTIGLFFLPSDIFCLIRFRIVCQVWTRQSMREQGFVLWRPHAASYCRLSQFQKRYCTKLGPTK